MKVSSANSRLRRCDTQSSTYGFLDDVFLMQLDFAADEMLNS
jgi:hypothetical protein